jgi:hypothetical protein
MKKIELLNILNFYISYYLLGLKKKNDFEMYVDFIPFKNKPILILKLMVKFRD